MTCPHGLSGISATLCKACHKEDAAQRRAQVKAGTHAYCVLAWRGDGRYRVEDAVTGTRYKLKSAADRRCDSVNPVYEEVSGGYVVRFVALPALNSAGTLIGRFQTQTPNLANGPKAERVTGTVKWFNDAKGYGMLEVEGCQGDVFAHYTAIYTDGFKTLKEGQTVTCKVIDGPKGPQAAEIYPQEATT